MAKKKDFKKYDEEIARLTIARNKAIDNTFKGNNTDDILKAQIYLSEQEEKKRQGKLDPKSYLFVPDEFENTGKGYKEVKKGISFEALKSIGNIFFVKLIHDTRIDQVKNFLQFTTDDQVEGFTIKKKRGLFDTGTQNLSKDEQKEVTKIVNFLEYCGNNSKWDNFDDFHEFIGKITRDSLTYDQLAFENVRSRNGELQKFLSVDSSMIRLLDSQDPRFEDQFQNFEKNGYMPKYCMSYNSQILEHPKTHQPVIYYPWELGYGIRNKVSDIRSNGYGRGELETGVELITWILWSFQYNGNFFKQGSQPKGFINIKDGNLDNTTINEFKDNWRQMMTSVSNSHKLPVFEGIDLEWVDLQKGNRDMEFNQWVEFLLVIFCSLYKIDPTELGFQFSQASSIFGQDGQKQRLDHSKSKGLKPLLVFLEKILTKYIVSELNEDYEFKFTGIDIEDEEAQVKLDKEKLDMGAVSQGDMFKKYSNREFNEKTDVILNPVYQQAMAAKMQGGDDMNSLVDEETGDEPANPYDAFNKSTESDPINSAAADYINKAFSSSK